MYATLGVKKMELFGVVGDGFDDQVPIRWEVDDGVVLDAGELETRVATVLGTASYVERKADIWSTRVALCWFAISMESFEAKKV